MRIKRVAIKHGSALMHIINSIGDQIDAMSTRIVLENCIDTGLITENAARIMAAAVSSAVMQNVPPAFKDTMRAAILKQMLLTQI